jgi:hypothetical protein
MDDRNDRNDQRREDECCPPLNNLRDKVEIIRRGDPDDAMDFLRTIISEAYYKGECCGREKQCHCITEVLRLQCCHCGEKHDDDK